MYPFPNQSAHDGYQQFFAVPATQPVTQVNHNQTGAVSLHGHPQPPAPRPTCEPQPATSSVRPSEICAGNPSSVRPSEVCAGDPSSVRPSEVCAGDPSSVRPSEVCAGDPSSVRPSEVCAGDPSSVRPSVVGVVDKDRATGKRSVDTSSYTVEQRVVAAAWVHERHHTHTSIGQIKQQFEARFARSAPAKNTLLVWERKLFSSGAVHDAPRAGRPASRKLLVGEVCASLRAAPALSVRARAAALRVPRSTLRALLRQHLPHTALSRPVKKRPRRARRDGAPPAPQP